MTRRGAAVLGSPIAHSLSPVLNLAAYDALGLADWTYRIVECTESSLASVLRALDAEGLAGAALTMPLKRAVLPLAARTDRVAADVGAANTVLFGGVPGEWWAANTDVPGMVDALRSSAVQIPSAATVLGAGATAASTIAALAEAGVRDVRLVARNAEAAAGLVPLAAGRGLVIEVVPWPSSGGSLEGSLVVSTVPAGAADALAGSVAPAAGAVLFDVVYAPWPTPLAAAWAARGGRVVGGLELLVAQAAHQVELMTGQAPPVEVMRAAGERALGRT